MSKKDNGSNDFKKENSNMNLSSKLTEYKSDFLEKNSINELEKPFFDDINSDINCINKIDLEKNLIVINKNNLKEINTLNKEITKKNNLSQKQKKGEIINIFSNNKFYYTHKDITNAINKSYGIYKKNIENSYNDNYNKIKYNMKFPNELIEKFFERKKNKKKENKDKDKDNDLYMNSFGINPLDRLKDIQEKMNDAPPTTKNNKISIKQFKINQRKLKEEDYKIQNYIKLFPVFNCPEHNIFKLNQYYYYNRINDDKNINMFKNTSISNNKNKKNKEKIDKDNQENEGNIIDRHIKNKNKFINKKRNKTKNKENKNYYEV